MHVPNLLQQRFVDALKGLTDHPDQFASMIRATTDPKHGDYQANCAMPLSKQPGSDQNPREIAATLVARLNLDDLCETPQIAGPGFINLKLKDSFLSDALRGMLGDARCSVPEVTTDKSIVIDFSSPNVAKPMHVGHIRSTVIGDALARILRFLGHPVITDNHLGDWGTQFGIIIYGYKHFGDPAVVQQDPVSELTKLYRLTNQLIEYRKALASIDPLSAAGCRGATAAGTSRRCRRKRRSERNRKKQTRVLPPLSVDWLPPKQTCVRLATKSMTSIAIRNCEKRPEAHPDIDTGGLGRNRQTAPGRSRESCPLATVLAALQRRDQSNLQSTRCAV